MRYILAIAAILAVSTATSVAHAAEDDVIVCARVSTGEHVRLHLWAVHPLATRVRATGPCAIGERA